MGCLIVYFKQQFSIYKQYYTYFYTLLHLYIFSNNTNNVIRTTLPNGSQNIVKNTKNSKFTTFLQYIRNKS